MGRLAEMQRKLLEVRILLTALRSSAELVPIEANDGSRSHGRVQREPSLVGRESLQELPVRNLSTCPLHQHSTCHRSFRNRVVSNNVSQKMDLGACPKSHTERLKTEFLAAREANPSDPIFARFQTEYESNIFAFVDECDRRIRAAHTGGWKRPQRRTRRPRTWYVPC